MGRKLKGQQLTNTPCHQSRAWWNSSAHRDGASAHRTAAEPSGQMLLVTACSMRPVQGFALEKKECLSSHTFTSYFPGPHHPRADKPHGLFRSKSVWAYGLAGCTSSATRMWYLTPQLSQRRQCCRVETVPVLKINGLFCEEQHKAIHSLQDSSGPANVCFG